MSQTVYYQGVPLVEIKDECTGDSAYLVADNRKAVVTKVSDDYLPYINQTYVRQFFTTVDTSGLTYHVDEACPSPFTYVQGEETEEYSIDLAKALEIE